MWHHGWHAYGVNAHQRHLEPQCGVYYRPWCQIINRKVPLNSLRQRSSPALSTQSSADRGFSFASLSLPSFLSCHKVSPRKSKFISNGYSSEQLVALFTKLGAISLLIHEQGPLIGPLLVSDLNHDVPVLPFPQIDGQEHRRLPVTGSSHHERTTQLPRSLRFPSAGLTSNLLWFDHGLSSSFSRPRKWRLSHFHSTFLMRSLKDFIKIFIEVLRLCIVALHHFPKYVTDVLWSSRSSVGPMSTCTPRAPDRVFARFPSLRRGPHPRFPAFLPGLNELPFHLFSWRSCFKVFLILPLSPSSTLTSSAKFSTILNTSVSLLALSLQQLTLVLFFSVTTIPSSSTLFLWHAVLRWSCMHCEWTNEERMTHMRLSRREEKRHQVTWWRHTRCSSERVVYRHGAILLFVRECSGFNPQRFRPHRSWWAEQRTK